MNKEETQQIHERGREGASKERRDLETWKNSRKKERESDRKTRLEGTENSWDEVRKGETDLRDL